MKDQLDYEANRRQSAVDKRDKSVSEIYLEIKSSLEDSISLGREFSSLGLVAHVEYINRITESLMTKIKEL